MKTAILDLCKWGWTNGASACVHLLNVLYCPKLHSCQRKHLYYEVQLLGILCALAHPLLGLREKPTVTRTQFKQNV